MLATTEPRTASTVKLRNGDSAKISDFYDVVPGLIEPLVERFGMDRSFILDFGCATGMIMHQIALHLPEAVFVGFDTDMEDLARGSSDLHPHPRITTRFADVRAPFGEQFHDRADAVIASWLCTDMSRQDFQSVLYNARRVLVQGGMLVVVMQHPDFFTTKASSKNAFSRSLSPHTKLIDGDRRMIMFADGICTVTARSRECMEEDLGNAGFIVESEHAGPINFDGVKDFYGDDCHWTPEAGLHSLFLRCRAV